jgi:hypothetical protein
MSISYHAQSALSMTLWNREQQLEVLDEMKVKEDRRQTHLLHGQMPT